MNMKNRLYSHHELDIVAWRNKIDLWFLFTMIGLILSAYVFVIQQETISFLNFIMVVLYPLNMAIISLWFICTVTAFITFLIQRDVRQIIKYFIPSFMIGIDCLIDILFKRLLQKTSVARYCKIILTAEKGYFTVSSYINMCINKSPVFFAEGSIGERVARYKLI